MKSRLKLYLLVKLILYYLSRYLINRVKLVYLYFKNQ